MLESDNRWGLRSGVAIIGSSIRLKCLGEIAGLNPPRGPGYFPVVPPAVCPNPPARSGVSSSCCESKILVWLQPMNDTDPQGIPAFYFLLAIVVIGVLGVFVMNRVYG